MSDIRQVYLEDVTVVGIDPSTTSTGVSCPKKGWSVTLRRSKSDTAWAASLRFAKEIRILVEAMLPDIQGLNWWGRPSVILLVLEQGAYGARGDAHTKLAELGALIKRELWDLPWTMDYTLSISTWRAVHGLTKAKKLDMLSEAERLASCSFDSVDEAEAWLIADAVERILSSDTSLSSAGEHRSKIHAALLERLRVEVV